MDKDINRIKVVLAKKGEIRETTECLVEDYQRTNKRLAEQLGVRAYLVTIIHAFDKLHLFLAKVVDETNNPDDLRYIH